jgi:steroid delta-isomerase-like uncharacterized protein
MSADQSLEVVRRALGPLDEVLAAHDELYGPDWVGHFPGMPPLRAEHHKQYAAAMAKAFPDLDRTIDDLFAADDKVVLRWSATGTHTGDFNGMPPTGRVATSSGITIFRVEDGRIVEEWAESDMLGLLQQLGAIPTPDGSAG